MAAIRRKTALILVDVQNDFMGPPGALGTPENTEIIAVINAVRDNFDLVVCSYDWSVTVPHSHPPLSPFPSPEAPGRALFIRGECQ